MKQREYVTDNIFTGLYSTGVYFEAMFEREEDSQNLANQK